MLIYNEKVCTGCRICEQICALEHYGEYKPALSRIRIRSIWPQEEKAVVCRQCKARSCLKACPAGAISFNGSHIVLKEELCTGCGDCLKACPFKLDLINPANGQPLFCDTCSGKYACVGLCPTKAIRKGGE